MNIKLPSSQDVYAAIAMALHETLGMPHDRESNVITIDDSKHLNSPWGAKEHTFPQDAREETTLSVVIVKNKRIDR